MEVTVRLFRVLANRSRIRILRLLAVCGELRVRDIQDATGLRQPAVSVHLRELAGVGLLWRRRSGLSVYYRLAEAPTRELTRSAVTFVRDAFSSVQRGAPRDVVADEQPDSAHVSDDALFRFFTSFTHPRRLQIVRRLRSGGGGRRSVMASELGMSPLACWRHVDKLERRGLVSEQGHERPPMCRLVRQKNALKRRLLEAVVAELESFHTS